jgi:hypothetical protein
MDNNPAIIDPQFPDVTMTKNPALTDEQVLAFDLQLDYFGFCQLARAWGMTESINDIGRCMLLQHAMQQQHRNHRLLPNAYQASQNGSRIFNVVPLD